MTFLLLMYEFFKTGLFSVGGGLATLPFLRDMTFRYSWFTMEELMNMIAVSESSPGPIGINMATYAGFMAGGSFGGVLATLAIITPSILIVVTIASFMERFQESLIIRRGFYLLRAATAGLIAGAVFEVIVLSLFNTEAVTVRWPAVSLFVVLVFLIRKFPQVHPIAFIVASAVLGIVFKL